MPNIENEELVRALRKLAAQFASQGNAFKAHGLSGAARSIQALARPVRDLWCAGGLDALTALPWVGKSVAQWIVDWVSPGSRHCD